jgi:hypothetical protein
LDKATTDQNKKVTGIISSRECKYSFRVDPEKTKELQGILDENHKDYAEKLALIQKGLKSFWGDKEHFAIMESIVELEESVVNNLWVTAYTMTYMEKRMANVETIVQGITDKLKVDLSSLRTEVEMLHKTIKEPMFTEVFQFVRSVKESAEKSKQAGEQYVE